MSVHLKFYMEYWNRKSLGIGDGFLENPVLSLNPGLTAKGQADRKFSCPEPVKQRSLESPEKEGAGGHCKNLHTRCLQSSVGRLTVDRRRSVISFAEDLEPKLLAVVRRWARTGTAKAFTSSGTT